MMPRAPGVPTRAYDRPMSATSSASLGRGRVPLRKLSTYAAGSAVATVCSEVTLVVCYGLLGLSPGWSSVLAWVAGALPNYWLNRSWTWQRRGRPSLRHEVLPYVVIVLVTLLLATLATGAVDAALSHHGSGVRTALVALTFLGVYVVMFLIRYVLMDRLFGRLDRKDEDQ
jgi:putative flippase GtrA